MWQGTAIWRCHLLLARCQFFVFLKHCKLKRRPIWNFIFECRRFQRFFSKCARAVFIDRDVIDMYLSITTPGWDMLVPILSFCCYIDLFCISVGGVVVEMAPSTTCNIIVTRCKCIDLKAMEHVNQRLVVFQHIVQISHSHTCVSEFINSPYLSALFCTIHLSVHQPIHHQSP